MCFISAENSSSPSSTATQNFSTNSYNKKPNISNKTQNSYQKPVMYNQDFLINAIVRHLHRRHAILIGVSLMQDQCFNIVNDIYTTTPQSDSRSNIIKEVTKIAQTSINDLWKVKAAAQDAKDPELNLELRTEISTALGNFSVAIKQLERAILESQKKYSLLNDKKIDEARYSLAKIVENANKFSSHMKEG